MTVSQTLATADVLEATAAVVSRYLGETMARSAIKAHCDKLQIEGARILPEQIEAFGSQDRDGPHIFVGREKATAAVAEMHGAIQRMGQKR